MDGLRRFPTTAEASSRLADWLRQRRMLLVVDDVWESEHARPFLLGGSGSAVLLTTRWPNVARELSSDNRRSYTLPALPEESALQLLRCLAPAIVATHPSHCRALASDLEHLPLALHLAGRLLRYEAGLGLNAAVMFDELRAEIKNTHGDSRYAAVPGLRHNLKTLLDRSLSRLDERARDAFAYLGAHAHKSAAFELETLQTSWGTADTRPLVSQLVGLGLLEPGIHGRFRMHTLLVNYAYGLLTSPGYRGRTERNHRF